MKEHQATSFLLVPASLTDWLKSLPEDLQKKLKRKLSLHDLRRIYESLQHENNNSSEACVVWDGDC